MNQQEHERAWRLMIDATIGILETEDGQWLDRHVSECAGCAKALAKTQSAVRDLRLAPVRADAALVDATRRNIHRYAALLRESRSRARMIIVSTVLAAAAGAASLSILWQALAWISGFLNLPGSVVYAVLLAFWLAPGLMAALAAMGRRPMLNSLEFPGGMPIRSTK